MCENRPGNDRVCNIIGNYPAETSHSHLPKFDLFWVMLIFAVGGILGFLAKTRGILWPAATILLGFCAVGLVTGKIRYKRAKDLSAIEKKRALLALRFFVIGMVVSYVIAFLFTSGAM